MPKKKKQSRKIQPKENKPIKISSTLIDDPKLKERLLDLAYSVSKNSDKIEGGTLISKNGSIVHPSEFGKALKIRKSGLSFSYYQKLLSVSFNDKNNDVWSYFFVEDTFDEMEQAVKEKGLLFKYNENFVY